MASQPTATGSPIRSGTPTAAAARPAAVLLEHVSDVVCVVDPAGVIRYVSPSLTRMLEWEPEDVVGRPVLDFLIAERHGDYSQVFAGVAAEPGTHGPFGLNFRRPDGSHRFLQVMVTNRLADPAVGGLVAVARDETERVVAEEARLRTEARFRALVRHSSDIVLLVDTDGIVQYASPSVETILGIPVHGSSRSVFELVHPDDHPAARAFIEALTAPVAAQPGVHVELRVQAVDGSWRHLEVLGTNLTADPDVGGLVINGRDVTDRRQAEDLVAEQAALLEGVALGHPLDETIDRVVAMVELRIPGAVASVAALGADGVMRHPHAPHLPGPVTQALDESPPDSELGRVIRQPHPALFRDILTDARWEHLRAPLVDAGFRSCWCFPMLVPGGGEQVGMVTVLHPDPRVPTAGEVEVLERARNLAAIAVERRRFEDQLEHQAVHDVLTGLPNRLLLLDRIEHALARGRHRGVDVGVLFVDLDHFKLVNDSLGHSAGDRLLEQVARRFLAAVGPSDTVGRFGGDEFVVVCEDVGGELGAVEVAEKLARSLAEPLQVGGAEVHASASIGITVAHDARLDAHSLIRDADAALYRAKDKGRAGYAVFEDELHARVVHRVELERALRGALVESQLAVHYQPIIRLADGRVVGAEALVRWHRPGVGLVEPEEFIAVAEETGLIVALDRWVLGQACTQLARWRAGGLGNDLHVNVNLSARHLGVADLPAIVGATIAGAQLPAAAVGLEITESALAADADASVAALDALAALGVQLAIDDFGTGYASLDYVRRFSVADQLKIDRSFVADLDSGAPRDQAIVSASLVLARDLGFTSVAEGVESEGQLAVLRALGCNLAQGFLFCPPVPPDEFEAWVRRRNGR